MYNGSGIYCYFSQRLYRLAKPPRPCAPPGQSSNSLISVGCGKGAFDAVTTLTGQMLHHACGVHDRGNGAQVAPDETPRHQIYCMCTLHPALGALAVVAWLYSQPHSPGCTPSDQGRLLDVKEKPIGSPTFRSLTRKAGEFCGGELYINH